MTSCAIAGHATAESLVAYADGSLSEGMCLMVAGHLTFCPSCRAKLARLEALGGALLAGTEHAGCTAPDIAAVLPRLDAPPDAPATETGPGLAAILPCPLRARICGAMAEATWTPVLPGLSEYHLEGFAPDQITLMRAEPGFRMPAHTHSGEEALLVIQGAMRDGGHIYRRGELALADHRDVHSPEVVGTETCVCLFLLNGRLEFTDPAPSQSKNGSD